MNGLGSHGEQGRALKSKSDGTIVKAEDRAVGRVTFQVASGAASFVPGKMCVTQCACWSHRAVPSILLRYRLLGLIIDYVELH